MIKAGKTGKIEMLISEVNLPVESIDIRSSEKTVSIDVVFVI
jgi:hypothetical protein